MGVAINDAPDDGAWKEKTMDRRHTGGLPTLAGPTRNKFSNMKKYSTLRMIIS